jgi:hypothetical protein
VPRAVSRHRLLAVGVGLATLFVTATPIMAGVLNASWTMPTTNADGSALTDLASFKVYYGTSNAPCPGASFVSVTAPTSAPGPNQTATTTLTGLTTGATYFAAVTAVDSSGAESACSPVGSAVARSDFSVTPSGTVDFGSVNIGTTADQTFTVQNTGGGTVSGNATTSAPFSVVSGGSFNLVGSGATATVTVRFTPTVAALATGNVTFTANSGSISSTVRGTGVVGSNPVPTLTALSSTSATAGGPAFTLTVTGTNFVSGSTVRWNGSARATTFVSATQLTAGITTADIATGGSVPVTVFTPTPGGGTSAALTFSVNNPAPTLTSLSPVGAVAGGAAFTLTVTGSNFVNGSTVNWNGSARTTTFVSATQLTAAISATDIATAASVSVTVVTPTPGGDTSAALTFPIAPGGPTLTAISPTSATAGGAAFTLTLTGSGFGSGTTAQWNGSSRTTTVVSATQLTAAITAADIAAAGTAQVKVTGSSGTSATMTFTTNNPAPAISSLSPTSATAGGAAFTLTVTGNNFVSGSSVRWNGSARTTTFVSVTQLTAAITAADIATAGSVPVTVFTPTPGGGTSAALSFAVNNPVPSLTSLSPAGAIAGGAAFTLTVNGSNFVNGSAVNWNGNPRTTTFVSATQLNAAITAADIATASSVSVTVITPAPGGGTSAVLTFPIAPGAPTLTAISPTSVTAGGAAFTLTLTGSGFGSGTTAQWNGTARTTTVVSATQLTAAITAADIATAGTAQVKVSGSSGTSAAMTFTINNPPPPTESSLSPTSASAGGPAFTLTVNGSNFVNGASVRWNGTARTTTFVSATQLTAAINVADIATAGSVSITVGTPAGTSAAQMFSVSNPAPVVNGLAPASATAGTGPLTLVVNGSGFTSASTVLWNGNSRTTAFASASQLTAIITAADVAVAGTAQVSVVTPAPGGGTSSTMAFGVNAGSTVNVGLVGYWRFNDGSGTIATDSSGVSGPGTLINGPVWTSGRLGQALSFNGVNAYVDVASNPSLNAFPLTVALWIKTAATTGVSGILSKATAGSGYAIYLSNGNLCATFFRDASNRVDDGSGCPLATAGYTDNQWHQVTYVVDASGARLYVDGVVRASLGWTGSAGAPATTQDLLIGRYPGAPAPEFFQGVIDDVRVYARALAASEAMELYTNFGTVADTTPPVISALTVTMVTPSTATVTFVTNEPSDTQLDYGTTTAYGTLSTLQPSLGTTHAQTLNSLAPGTTYYVRARSRDFSGNLGISNGITFRTADAPVNVPTRARKNQKNFFDQVFSWLGL